MVNFTNNTKILAEDAFEMISTLGFRPTFITTHSEGLEKYTVRLARKAEVPQFIEKLHLYKS